MREIRHETNVTRPSRPVLSSLCLPGKENENQENVGTCRIARKDRRVCSTFKSRSNSAGGQTPAGFE